MGVLEEKKQVGGGTGVPHTYLPGEVSAEEKGFGCGTDWKKMVVRRGGELL